MTFAQIKGLFFDYWWIAGLALILIAIAAYGFCGGSGPDKKAEQIQSNGCQKLDQE